MSRAYRDTVTDYRRFQEGQVVTVQPPPAGGAAVAPEEFRVVEVRIAQAVLQPVNRLPWALPAGVPVIARFWAGGRDRTVEALVVQARPDGSVLVRLPELPDRRTQRRLDVELVVDVEAVEATAPTAPATCRSLDLSGGGVRLLTRTPMRRGTLAFVCVHLPDEVEPVVALAGVLADSVAMGDGYETRLAFSTIADDQRGRLLLFLAHRT